MAAIPYLDPIDLNQLELRNAVIHLLASDPTPTEGQIWFNTTTHRLKAYINGTVKAITTDDLAILTGAAAGGDLTGTYPNPTLSATANVNSIIRANRLDQFAAPTADVSLNGQHITNLASPVNPNDAVNLVTLQSVVSGLSSKAEVNLATAAALPANTYSNGASGVGATLTATGNGALTVDGVAVAAGNRILVKNEVATTNNGIYIVTATGGAGAAYVLTRATDYDQAAEIGPGALIPVEGATGFTGTSNNGTVYISLAPSPFVVGTSALAFTSIGSTYTAGTGLTLSGTQFSLTTPVTVLNGGTGATTVAGAKTNLGFMTRYASTIGDGTTTSFVLTHNLGTVDISISCRRVSDGKEMRVDNDATSSNTATVNFSVAPATNAYRVTIIG